MGNLFLNSVTQQNVIYAIPGFAIYYYLMHNILLKHNTLICGD